MAQTVSWAIVLDSNAAPGYVVNIISNGAVIWTTHINPGLSASQSPYCLVIPGVQKIELLDPSGKVIISASGGLCLSDSCLDGIYNFNYQAIPLVPDAGNDAVCTVDSHNPDGSRRQYYGNAGWRNVSCDNPSLTTVSNNPANRWRDTQATITWNDALWGLDVQPQCSGGIL